MSDRMRWSRKRTGLKFALIVAAFLICLSIPMVWNLFSQDVQEKQETEEHQEIQVLPEDTSPLLAPRQAVRVAVPSSENWTDTGYRVLAGQDIHSPDGLPMKTVQQAFRDENIGALIGKVVRLVAIEVDEETGEETRFEEESLFYIGAMESLILFFSWISNKREIAEF